MNAGLMGLPAGIRRSQAHLFEIIFLVFAHVKFKVRYARFGIDKCGADFIRKGFGDMRGEKLRGHAEYDLVALEVNGGEN